MPNLNYLRGRRFEYERMKFYREKGYEVLRSAGSHGDFDLVAYDFPRPVLLVQCKVVNTKKQATRLIINFEADAQPSKFFHQRIDVYVKESKEVQGWEL